MNSLGKRERQQITLSHLSDIDFKYFKEIYKTYTAESIFF